MNLVIDIGNTLQKIAVFDNDDCVDCRTVSMITEDILISVFNQYALKYSIISSVAEVDEQVVHFLQNHTQMVHYSHQTKLPVTILYKSVETLGLDRIANAVGAAALHPARNVLSIQAGTCLVLDFVNEKGEYLGGSISPGLNMRFEALHEKTKNLPYFPYLLETEMPPNFLGTDTDGSLSSGVMYGMCCEIDGFIEYYKTKFNNLIVLLSGGDANILKKSIKNTIFAAPNVVLKGLNEIIKYNG
jgi:type III pantothenate kinase